MLEQSWYTMVSLFPQVNIWEVGNEWNPNAFLQPDGFQTLNNCPPFTVDEKMNIAVDMMYFAARGIRRATPKALILCRRLQILPAKRRSIDSVTKLFIAQRNCTPFGAVSPPTIYFVMILVFSHKWQKIRKEIVSMLLSFAPDRRDACSNGQHFQWKQA